MIKIGYKSEVQNFNPIERTCMVVLYGLALLEGKEIGRFFLEKKIISGVEYDLYVDQANQLVDEHFLKKWEYENISNFKDSLRKLEEDSNSEKERISKK